MQQKKTDNAFLLHLAEKSLIKYFDFVKSLKTWWNIF